jgi:hypothetical protein
MYINKGLIEVKSQECKHILLKLQKCSIIFFFRIKLHIN